MEEQSTHCLKRWDQELAAPLSEFTESDTGLALTTSYPTNLTNRSSFDSYPQMFLYRSPCPLDKPSARLHWKQSPLLVARPGRPPPKPADSPLQITEISTVQQEKNPAIKYHFRSTNANVFAKFILVECFWRNWQSLLHVANDPKTHLARGCS